MLCLGDDGSKSKQNSAAFCDLASKISCAELLKHTVLLEFSQIFLSIFSLFLFETCVTHLYSMTLSVYSFFTPKGEIKLSFYTILKLFSTVITKYWL